MTDPAPDLERIVNAMAPAVPFRAEVEEAIEQYVGARREQRSPKNGAPA